MKTWKGALLAIPLLVCGCAWSKMERVNVRTEGLSSGRIQVTAPRVYRDSKGFVIAGYLRARDCGAHSGHRGHLHAQEIDARGVVIRDTVTEAPSIRHNPRSFNETVAYSMRMRDLNVADAKVRILLHQAPSKDCAVE